MWLDSILHHWCVAWSALPDSHFRHGLVRGWTSVLIWQVWAFLESLSSPHYPQSNGKAESTIKSTKQLLKAAWNNAQLTRASKLALPYNTTTHHAGETVYSIVLCITLLCMTTANYYYLPRSYNMYLSHQYSISTWMLLHCRWYLINLPTVSMLASSFQFLSSKHEPIIMCTICSIIRGFYNPISIIWINMLRKTKNKEKQERVNHTICSSILAVFK